MKWQVENPIAIVKNIVSAQQEPDGNGERTTLLLTARWQCCIYFSSFRGGDALSENSPDHGRKWEQTTRASAIHPSATRISCRRTPHALAPAPVRTVARAPERSIIAPPTGTHLITPDAIRNRERIPRWSHRRTWTRPRLPAPRHARVHVHCLF